MYGNYYHQSVNKNSIIEVENLDNFGIYFGSTKSLEEFQKNSGMSGAYSVEYQYHSWDAIGRLKKDDQILDICIPLVFFNYEQDVSGGSVEFHLQDVEDAAELCKVAAEAKFKELRETMFFKELESMGIVDWKITSLSNLHVHP